MPIISIIIPVYNSADYLEQAINSILNQSFDSFELILVNDASTDSSGDICENYKQLDKRVKVVHFEKNKGLCAARNKGIDMAKGQYMTFCDDDDIYESNLLEDNYKLAVKHDADMVKFGRSLIDIDKNGNLLRKLDSNIPTLKIYEGQGVIENFFQVKSLNVLINVWNGLYKTKTIRENKIRFDETMKFGSEDADFSLNLYLHTQTLVINPGVYYVHYRRSMDSTSRKYNINKVQSMIKTLETEKKVWDKLENNMPNRVEIIRSINNSIINIIFVQLFHDDCNLSKKEKRDLIASFKENKNIIYENINNKIVLELFKINVKQGLFTILYNNNKHGILLNLLSVYNKAFGLKW
jgi:glycosyltransferase involved in cell wall biosynthesis